MYPILWRGLIFYFVDKNRYNAFFSISFKHNISSTIGYIHTEFQVKTRTLTGDMEKNVMYSILMRATVCGSQFWFFSRKILRLDPCKANSCICLNVKDRSTDEKSPKASIWNWILSLWWKFHYIFRKDFLSWTKLCCKITTATFRRTINYTLWWSK